LELDSDPSFHNRAKQLLKWPKMFVSLRDRIPQTIWQQAHWNKSG